VRAGNLFCGILETAMVAAKTVNDTVRVFKMFEKDIHSRQSLLALGPAAGNADR